MFFLQFNFFHSVFFLYSIGLVSVYDVDNVAELTSLLMPVFFVKNTKKCVFLYLVLFLCFCSEFFPAWTILAQNDERKNPDNVATYETTMRG